MSASISIRPINSILFLSDESGGEPPVPVRGSKILATPSCISFRCYPEQDGPTEILIGKTDDLEVPADDPAFDGQLETPGRHLVVSMAHLETVLQVEAPNPVTRVRIWPSHPEWPDKVTIGLD